MILFSIYLLFLKIVICQNLQPYEFTPLPLGEILPSGWLKNQISVQASGLSGYIDEYWSDIQSSGWIGGWAEGWERFPYFMDGFYSLAVLSKDEKLMSKAMDHIDYILSHQTEDGWIGPDPGHGNLGKGFNPKNDPWPSFVMLKCLIQVHSHTKNKTIYNSAMKVITKIDEIISKQGLDPFVWAKYRLMDFVYVLEYMYDVSNKPELYEMISKYSYEGFDWFSHFSNFSDFEQKQHYKVKSDNLRNHGVNNAQAVKFPAVRFRFDKKSNTSDLVEDWVIKKLQKYHGTSTGLFHGDELYGGLSPTQGSELCLVVEYMFSFEVSLLITGKLWLGDLLEKIAYNNLPAVLDQSMKLHQYVTLDNQVICKRGILTNFTDVGSYGPLYGVSPNYGCCTANFHQGWPKFTSNLWGVDRPGKLTGNPAIMLLIHAPSTVSTQEVLSNPPTTISLEYLTSYPFGNGTGVIHVLSDTFPTIYSICYRVPGWSSSSKPRIQCTTTAWKKGDVMKVEINMKFHLSEYSYHNSVSLFRGPLLLSKGISSKDEEVHACIDPHDKHSCEDYYDIEKLPQEDWNYAIDIDRLSPSKSIISVDLGEIPDPPFSRSKKSPVVVTVNGAKVDDWKLSEKYRIAEEVPNSPVKKTGEIEKVQLVPVGSTDLRISVFPTLN